MGPLVIPSCERRRTMDLVLEAVDTVEIVPT